MNVRVQTAVFLYMTFVVEFRLGGVGCARTQEGKTTKKPGKKNTSVSNRLRARPVRKCPVRKEEEAWLLVKPLPQVWVRSREGQTAAMLPDQVERTDEASERPGGRGRRGRS